jgi:hypothetical protein
MPRQKIIRPEHVDVRLVPTDRMIFERALDSTVFVDMDELLNYGALPLFLTVDTALQHYQVEYPTKENLRISMVNDKEQRSYEIYNPSIIEDSDQHQPKGQFTFRYTLNYSGQNSCNMIKRAMIVAGQREIIVWSLAFYTEVVRGADQGFHLKFVTDPPNGGIVIPIPGYIPASER